MPAPVTRAAQRVKQAAVCGAAVLILLGMLEITLHISAAIGNFFYRRDVSLPEADTAARNIIFCFGDSYTYGVGAEPGCGYPEQLERMLSSDRETPVRVYNFGVPGANSSQVLLRMRQILSAHHPDLVIVLCGGNDRWNFSGVSLRSWPRVLARALTHSKLYRFITVRLRYRAIAQPLRRPHWYHRTARISTLPYDAAQLIQFANVLRQYGYYSDAQSLYVRALEKNPQDQTALLEWSRCAKLDQDYRRAVAILLQRAVTRLDPEALAEMTDIFQRIDDRDARLTLCEEYAPQAASYRELGPLLAETMAGIAGAYALHDDLRRAADIYTRALALDPQCTRAVDGLAAVDTARVLRQRGGRRRGQTLAVLSGLSSQDAAHTLLQDNLRQMVLLCRRHKVKLLFSGYPQGIADAFRETAAVYRVPVVDHAPVFTEKLRDVSAEVYFIAGQGSHCTAAGYALMAQGIAGAIRDGHVLEGYGAD